MPGLLLKRQRGRRDAWPMCVALCLLGCLGMVQAGVLVAPPAPISLSPAPPPSIQAAPIDSSVIRSAPLEAPPLQRVDAQDMEVRSQIESLMRLASPMPSASKAARTEDPGQAAWILGLIYLHGAGVPQDAGLAHQWFERALNLNQRMALAGLAWCAIEGCGHPPRPADAGQWIQPLKRIARPRALYLEWLALDRLQPLRTARPELQAGGEAGPLPGRSLLLAAARGGDIHAQIELGLDAVARGRPQQAIVHFEAAAPASPIAGINAAIVAQTLQARQAPARDDQTLAAEIYSEAQQFHRGEGRPVNHGEAIRLYRLAASKGSAEAARMLALIYSRPLVRGALDVAWMSQLGQLDLSQPTLRVRTLTAPRQLQRESTALIDLLPPAWRARIF